MNIKRVSEDDKEATHKLIFSHMSTLELDGFKLNNPGSYQSVVDILDGQYGLCLVAKDHDLVVGYLIAADKSSDVNTIRYAELRNMRVQIDHQGKGIGSLLVQEFIRWAKSEGYERLSVDVYALSKKNIGFYRKFGFAPKTLTMEHWFS